MTSDKIYDLIGIGIGPFNLGLAALAHDIPELECIFIDEKAEFDWHPGLMLPNAKMQVPFYADLITLADPTSKFTYMNYLKETGNLFRFAISESYFPYRSEYNNYCKWVANQLSNLCFGFRCDNITYTKTKKLYTVHTQQVGTGTAQKLHGKHIVIGVGSDPFIPECAENIKHPNLFHASQYLQHKHSALMKRNITLIGSGQSAAEIFQDLLPHINDLDSLSWFTQSGRFYTMDYSKFSLEMSSPEYINYFYGLPQDKKADILARQHDLYKGINFSLIDDIYQQLYLLSLDKNNHLPRLFPNCRLEALTQQHHEFNLKFMQLEQDRTITHATDTLILATGYRLCIPAFTEGIKDCINWNKEENYSVNKSYSVDNRNSIFVQNADLHTHGFNSADLGLGPHRNAVILNSILEKEHFKLESAFAFQSLT